MITKLQIFPDLAALSQAAAEMFVQIGQAAIDQRGRFLVALSGGSTPLALFRLLAQQPSRHFAWDKLYVFWGDERCVAATDPNSNYAQAYSAWLAQAAVPARNIHRIQGELEPAQAAAEYAAQLQHFAEDGRAWPHLDWALMGLGSDGHTASLFPGSPIDAPGAVIAVTAQYQDRPARRVSLTPQVFNDARNLIFLAAGAEKSAAVATTLTGPRDLLNFPAQRIQPSHGVVWWLVDQAAAALLPDSGSSLAGVS